MKHRNIQTHFFLFLIALFGISCGGGTDQDMQPANDSLAEIERHKPENALKGLTVYEGLEVTPFATEPMLINPTNMDIDEMGRVWVLEAYNYRPGINGNPTHPEGDRIVILSDSNGDGRADSSSVFYQGPELNAPLGIAVLGNRVIVSQSPYIWAFYDDNGDLKADRKEIMFQGISGEQHDHGVHSFTFGPDGKLYFNFGNEGKTLQDKNGKTVLDQDGDEIGPKKYRMGMVFRCDPDGSNVECLGHNFRNNYEVAVDSYGTMWQSDNDDDGNKGVRINYVMPYGNYGYQDEMTGASWSENRTNREDSIPLRHWHLNDPGVVPNLLQTGAGSPTGMVVYEGELLPEVFRNQMIHTDAGPNVVRSYPVEKSGAGYTATLVNILKGEKDPWFRPSDVCVAPDGSLFVADWYDPGVGGHAAGDQQRGRIYRIAPKSAAGSYKMPARDYSTPEGAVQALQSPNLAVRHHAWQALQTMGKSAIPALEKVWTGSSNPRMKARAFWALVKMQGGESYINQAISHENSDLRITGLRAALQLNHNKPEVIKKLAEDKDPQVRRECALALRHLKSPEAASLWTKLAQQYDGKDRWYLEALGIGADRQWDAFFRAWQSAVGDVLKDNATRDIVWRARTDEAVPYLAKLASDNSIPLQNRLKYFRAFDFNTGPAKQGLLLKMIENNTANDIALNKLVLTHLDVKSVKSSPAAGKALKDVLRSVDGTKEYIELTGRHEVKEENPRLLELAISRYTEPLGRDAIRLFLKQGDIREIHKIINGTDTARANHLIKTMAGVGSKTSLDLMTGIIQSDKYPDSLRYLAASYLGRSGGGEERVLELLKNKKVPEPLIPAVVSSVSRAWRGSVRAEAASYLPGAEKKQAKPWPSFEEVTAGKADPANGKKVYQVSCALCHKANGDGYDYGPSLSEIGSKLPKEAIYDAMVNPSKGISFGYEGWELTMKDGSVVTGIIASKTESEVTVKYPGGGSQVIKASDISSRKQLKESMMTAGLNEGMNNQQIADLLEYLAGLKKSK